MTPMLHTEQLTLKRDKVLCKDLTISVKPGERWALLGPNGCGKSTLLHCLAGLREPSAGVVKLNQHALSSLPTRQIAQQIGILLQDSIFPFPQTVYEYCLTARFPYRPAFSLKAAHGDDMLIIDHAISEMQIGHLTHKNVQQLSGGEKRRVAITALLIQDPAILLLDEPGNHLDLHQQIRVLDQISKRAQNNRTIIMSLHDINLAQQYCNRCLMIFPDASTIHGNTSDVLTSENLQRLYHHPMQSIRVDGKIYWLPKQIIKEET